MRANTREALLRGIMATAGGVAVYGLEKYVLKLDEHGVSPVIVNAVDYGTLAVLYGGAISSALMGIRAYAESRLDRIQAIRPRPQDILN